jgi:hypothetical protein
LQFIDEHGDKCMVNVWNLGQRRRMKWLAAMLGDELDHLMAEPAF